MKEFKRETRNDRQGSGRFDRRGSRGSDRDSGGFNRERSSGGFGGRSSGGFNRGKSRRKDEVTMHKVICDGCGKECEVPFKPTASKPVYCNDCFKGKGKSNSSQECNCKDELEKINQKIEKILGLIESMKKMHTPSKVEQAVEVKEKKPKTKKTAAKKKTVKKKTTKKKTVKKK